MVTPKLPTIYVL